MLRFLLCPLHCAKIAYCRHQKFSASQGRLQDLDPVSLLLLLRDRPCLEHTIVSSNFVVLLFSHDKVRNQSERYYFP